MSTGSNFVIDITIRNDNITTTSHPFVRTKYGMLMKFDTKYINAPKIKVVPNILSPYIPFSFIPTIDIPNTTEKT